MSEQQQPIRTANGDDVTEAVQILYDIAHGSMDWGSGFLDNDEMAAVIRFAVLMGWQVPSLPRNSEALLSVAREFPEHYEFVEKVWPASTIVGETIPERRWVEVNPRPTAKTLAGWDAAGYCHTCGRGGAKPGGDGLKYCVDHNPMNQGSRE